MTQQTPDQSAGATATATREAPKSAPPKLDRLPPYRVLLHNDDVNDMLDVVGAILELTPLNRTRAFEIMMTAHQRGMSLLLLTHRERAELYQEQFRAKRLTVTIEPNT
ncbi:MAG: ATP-dependent Clp protease adaptor ClpS [Phycisphaerales bacterium JB059]